MRRGAYPAVDLYERAVGGERPVRRAARSGQRSNGPVNGWASPRRAVDRNGACHARGGFFKGRQEILARHENIMMRTAWGPVSGGARGERGGEGFAGSVVQVGRCFEHEKGPGEPSLAAQGNTGFVPAASPVVFERIEFVIRYA